MRVERGVRVAGRYEVLNRLGRGGMGEVWAARDHTLHREIALKLLDLNGADDPELVQRFEREAVAAAQINHPNVVALHDRGTHEDMLYIIMEKVEGGTLTETIRTESPMPLDRALGIADEICTALAAAHEARVIHYDIKPHNVMLTRDGRVKVVDFGIAGFIQATFSIANSSQLSPAGTIEYGAPEQFLNERGDERSDLYALGGVLFAMLAGRPPFTGHNSVAVMRSKLDEVAPQVDSFRPDVPPAVTELIAELLNRDASRRPQSARAVHERLQRLMASEAPTRDAAPRPRSTKVAPPPPRTRAMTDPQPSGGPFTISWTGKEPLDDYLNVRKYKRKLRSLAVGFVACFAIAALMISWADSIASQQSNSDAAGALGAGGLFVFPLGGIVCISWLVAFYFRTRTRKKSWSLHIGSPGIRVTRDTDKHEYRWEGIHSYSIGEFAGSSYQINEWIAGGGERGTGLFVKFSEYDEELHDYTPAGWPFGTVVVSNGMVPLCVLGPMTDRQKAALHASLARYAPGKNDAELWGQ